MIQTLIPAIFHNFPGPASAVGYSQQKRNESAFALVPRKVVHSRVSYIIQKDGL